MDSPRAEAIMTRLKRSSVGEGATVRASGRVVEVRGCGGHYYQREGKDVWKRGVVGTSTATRLWVLYLSDVELFRAQDAIGGVDDLWISKRGGSVSESGMRNRCCSNPLHFTQGHDMIRSNYLQTHSRGPGWKIPRRVKGEKGKVHRTELQKPSRSGGPLYHPWRLSLDSTPNLQLRCPLHARRSMSRSGEKSCHALD